MYFLTLAFLVARNAVCYYAVPILVVVALVAIAVTFFAVLRAFGPGEG